MTIPPVKSGLEGVARREEFQEQTRLALLLDKWLPVDSFWTAFEPTARSALAGVMRKKRGVKPGVPDVLVWHRGKAVAVELKSRRGQCGRPQREVRLRILAAGTQWWMARSARAAMWALAESGVLFRTLVHADGTIEDWQRPELPAWEVPKRDPNERRPRAPKLGQDPKVLKEIGRLRVEAVAMKLRAEGRMPESWPCGSVDFQDVLDWPAGGSRTEAV